MTLDTKLWLFGYKSTSRSMIKLRDALDVYSLKNEGSTWKGKAGQYVLNWGAGTGVFTAKVGEATVLNTPQQVDTAINKLDFFRQMRGKDAPRVPFWTQRKDQAEAWLAGGSGIVCRTKVEGRQGEGIVTSTDPSTELPEASLYTVLVPSVTEYRVYLFNSQVLDAREKLLEEGQDPDPLNMRYQEDKYKYCKLVEPLPDDVREQAVKCIKKVGLFTGGVDVLWDGHKATVLEVNSAPWLSETIAGKYAEAITNYLIEIAA